jgi:hypothetical protein
MTTFTKNFLLKLIIPFFITNLTTNTMEHSQPIVPRPTINAKLYIDHRAKKATYAGSNYYEYMNKAGISSSIQNQQKMPLINIIVMDADETDWTNNIPKAIQKYEWKDNLTIEEQKKQFRKIWSKNFPQDIPADLLYERKTGDSISLTVFGYPVIATCTDNPAANLSFQKHFAQHMTNFIKRPTYFFRLDKNSVDVTIELEEAGLIDDRGYHGDNGFISIDKLLLEDKNIPSIVNYLRQREIGQKNQKISSNPINHTGNILTTQYSCLPKHNAQDDNDHDRIECIIS